MSYLTDNDIMNRLQEHLEYALSVYDKDWFVICVQGSQNYGMSDENSDVDSKLLVLPSLNDLVLNSKAISHTLEMPDNQEHIDVKDARDYFKIFRKSNINFVEILFTDYWIVNELYEDLWLELRARAEELARINPYAAVSCMKGMASEKVHALCHEYPSRMHMIEKFGYDPKQLSHLIRIAYFTKWYIEGKPYKDCIYPEKEWIRNQLLECKRNGWNLSKEEAVAKADEVMDDICYMANNFRASCSNVNDPELDKFLNDVLCKMLKRSLKKEL